MIRKRRDLRQMRHTKHLVARRKLLQLLTDSFCCLAAYASVRFLMRYFKVGRLDPFAYYCWAAGGLTIVGLALRG